LSWNAQQAQGRSRLWFGEKRDRHMGAILAERSAWGHIIHFFTGGAIILIDIFGPGKLVWAAPASSGPASHVPF